MELIKTILPLIGVALGWLFSESEKIFADKKQNKRKLKKLLFFLLELRYRFGRELSIELGFDQYFETMKTKMADKFGLDKNDPELDLSVDAWKPIIEEIIIKPKNQDSKFEYLSENIDRVLVELAEIFPILAYELNGQHNIKERLSSVDNYFDEIQSMTDEIPFDIKKWFNPKLTKELLTDLDESIEKIAKQIDKETLNISREKIAEMTFNHDNTKFDEFINEYFDKFIESITNE